MVFLIDLPRIEEPDQQADKGALTPFHQELVYFLEAQGLDESLIRSLAKYDFSETAHYGFIHTMYASTASETSPMPHRWSFIR